MNVLKYHSCLWFYSISVLKYLLFALRCICAKEVLQSQIHNTLWLQYTCTNIFWL